MKSSATIKNLCISMKVRSNYCYEIDANQPHRNGFGDLVCNGVPVLPDAVPRANVSAGPVVNGNAHTEIRSEIRYCVPALSASHSAARAAP